MLQAPHLIPFAVLGASILGSGHCASMCGGLILTVARTRRTLIEYHLGRLIGYLVLGLAAGFVGEKLLNTTYTGTEWLSWSAALFLGLSLMIVGIQTWRKGALHFSILPNSLIQFLFKMGRGRALSTGFFTAFLPCGWLHSFVLGAVATQSAWKGAAFLFLFWTGTLPALGLGPWVIGKFLQPLAVRAPKFSALLLIAAGLFSIGAKIAPTLYSPANSAAPQTCHHH